MKTLVAILLLISNICFAQFKSQQTQFDRFVKKPVIEWAAYVSDTFNFSNTGLNNLLLKRLTKKEIKASLPVETQTGDANHIVYLLADSINHIFHFGYHPNGPLYDSLGNIIQAEVPAPKIDTSIFTLTQVTQILYVENGKLKSYIPYITPTLPVHMSTGLYLGESLYFTTCFNYKYNRKVPKKNKLIFLSQTKKMVKLKPAEPIDNLKEMYGQNLAETIWPYVLKNEIDVFTIDSNKQVKPQELNSTSAFEQQSIVPVFDSANNIVAYNIVAAEMDTRRFTDVQLIQDWYYDYRKNKIYSNIKEMILFLKKDDKEPLPVLRLIFK